MRFAAAFVVSWSCVAACSAVPIVFTYQGSGTGTLAGASFGNAPFVITAHGDTINRQLQAPGIYYIDHDAAQIDLGGVGVLAFTSGTRTFVNQTGSLVGLSRAGATGSDLLNSANHSVYATWDMTSSIGPLAGMALMQWAFSPPVTTTGGTLFFETEVLPGATFTARIVPEPSAGTVALLAAFFGVARARTGRRSRR